MLRHFVSAPSAIARTATAAPRFAITMSSATAVGVSSRRAYFVHHKKTPNPDCMMFVVPQYRFKIGTARVAEPLPPPVDEEDWDGPGPVKIKAAVVPPTVGADGSVKQGSGVMALAAAPFVDSVPLPAGVTSSPSSSSSSSSGGHVEHGAGGDATSPYGLDDRFATNAAGTPACEREEAAALTQTAADPNAAAGVGATRDLILKSRNSAGGKILHAASRPTKEKARGLLDEQQQRQQTQPQSSSSSSTTTSSSAAAAGGAASNIIVDATDIAYTYSFTKDQMHLSPLARRVFECDVGRHIAEVVVGKDFVTVRRKSDEELVAEAEAEEALRATGFVSEEESREVMPIVTSMNTLSRLVVKDEQKPAAAAAAAAAASVTAATAGAEGSAAAESNGAAGTGGVDAAAAAAAAPSPQTPLDATRERLSDVYRESAAAHRDLAAAAAAAATPPAPSPATATATPTSTVGDATADPSAPPAAAEPMAWKQATAPPPTDAEAATALVAPNWFDLLFSLTAAITDHLYFHEPAVDLQAEHPYADTEPHADDTEIVSSIKELIAVHLRLLLQSDGGDLKFHGLDAASGVIRVEMLGSCKTCKKSDTTLRDLIERTVRHYVPEVKEVVEVDKTGALRERKVAAAAATA